MLHFTRSKLLFVLTLSFIGLFLSGRVAINPNGDPDGLSSILPQKSLTLGLDLQGGVHMLLEVDEAKLVQDHYALILGSARQNLRAENVFYRNLQATKSGISFQTEQSAQDPLVRKAILDLDPGLEVSQDGTRWHVSLKPETQAAMLKQAVEKSVETIRRRVDETGTKEPTIQPEGNNRILLQVPGVSNPERVKLLIGKTARLSFHLVKEHLASRDEVAPSSAYEVLPHATDNRVNRKNKGFYLLEREAVVTGDMLVNAQPDFGEYNKPVVQFWLNDRGGQRFSHATRNNIGRHLAIVLDGAVIQDPVINDTIGRVGTISGGFSNIQEAQDLALLLRSGALPAPLHVLEEKTVGPGLGSDSIKTGTFATLIAVACVVALMFLAYQLFGTFATLALGCNLIFLMGGMAYLGATLTLPGIAGIALTVGMAVDANVLINERIREELALGRSLLAAIDFGYRRAMTTILDSNLTTLIGAGILYIFGTGPVRGFAVTLALGVLISMFTAVTLSRAFVYLWIYFFKPRRLSF
jgi:preprotein translocase subunit SecD